MLIERLLRTVGCLSGLTTNVKIINEKMNTLITQDSYNQLFERIDNLSGLISNNSSSNTPESGETDTSNITIDFTDNSGAYNDSTNMLDGNYNYDSSLNAYKNTGNGAEFGVIKWFDDTPEQWLNYTYNGGRGAGWYLCSYNSNNTIKDIFYNLKGSSNDINSITVGSYEGCYNLYADVGYKFSFIVSNSQLNDDIETPEYPDASDDDLMVTGSSNQNINGLYKLYDGNANDTTGVWKHSNNEYYIYYDGGSGPWIMWNALGWSGSPWLALQYGDINTNELIGTWTPQQNSSYYPGSGLDQYNDTPITVAWAKISNDTEPTPPQEVTYVYECTSCGDPSVIGKYRIITQEEYNKIYPDTGFTFKNSTATNTYTYYMNETASVIIEEDKVVDDTYGIVYVYTIMESQVGSWLYCYPFETAILMCSKLEAVMDFEWQLYYGVEPPPTFIKL